MGRRGKVSKNKEPLSVEILAKAPICPDSITQKHIWREVVSPLVKQQILTALDLPSITHYCQCLENVEILRLQLQEEGLIVKGRAHAAIKPALEFMKMANTIGSAYGLNPVARSRVIAWKNDKSASSSTQDAFEELKNSKE